MQEEFITPVKVPDSEYPVLTDGQTLSSTPRQLDLPSSVSPQIDNTNRNFRGQQKNEVAHCFTRRHWIVLLPHFIGFSIFLLAIIGFFIFASKDSVESLMSIATYRFIAFAVLSGLTFYLHRFFVSFFNYYLQIFIITNFRVLQLDQTLFFTRNRDSIDLPEIQDIVIQQKGVVKTVLNYGEIIITLSSAHATKTLLCIPNPEYFFRKINKTKREYITMRRGEKRGIP